MMKIIIATQSRRARKLEVAISASLVALALFNSLARASASELQPNFELANFDKWTTTNQPAAGGNDAIASPFDGSLWPIVAGPEEIKLVAEEIKLLELLRHMIRASGTGSSGMAPIVDNFAGPRPRRKPRYAQPTQTLDGFASSSGQLIQDRVSRDDDSLGFNRAYKPKIISTARGFGRR